MYQSANSIALKFFNKYKKYLIDQKSKRKSGQIRTITSKVKYFCAFIGYPRSGHSLVGSLLDAHANINIANELDAFKYFANGFNRDQIYYLTIKNSEDHARKGRSQTGYKYDIKNQWQGRFSELLVIGDKKGGMTTQRIGSNPELIDKARKVIKTDIKFIHVVRNPFDNITTMTLRTNSTLLKEIFHFFHLCTINLMIREIAGDGNVLDVRHENLIENPTESIGRMLSFLDVESYDNYLSDCAGIIYKKPHNSRRKINWIKKYIRLVEQQISRYPFLEGYTFDSL